MLREAPPVRKLRARHPCRALGAIGTPAELAPPRLDSILAHSRNGVPKKVVGSQKEYMKALLGSARVSLNNTPRRRGCTQEIRNTNPTQQRTMN